MAMEPNVFIKSLHNSSRLVKKWGEQRPQNDKSLRELLSINGVSVWDIMAAELALYFIGEKIEERSGRKTLRQILTPYLRPIKYAFWRKSPVNTIDCDHWPAGSTALFIGFTSYMARDVLQPVIDLMSSEDGLIPVMLTSDLVITGDQSNQVHSINRHRSEETVNEARKWARAIRKASLILTREEKYRQIFVDGDRPLWPRVKHGVRRVFNVYASHFLPDTIAVAMHILTVHRPSVIVSIDVADPRTRVYSMLAASLGIPTVQVQSGPVDQGVIEWRFLLDDIVVAQGPLAKEVFLGHGVPNEKILVTGSPRYDCLVAATELEIYAFRKRFGVPPGNRTIVFASSYFLALSKSTLPETFALLQAMKRAMFAAVAQVPGVTLIVKPHPLEDVAETKASVVDHSRVIFADPKEDIRPLVSACDAFFTLGSTATLDGLIMGKPTVCPAFPGWLFSDAFVLTGAVEVPRTENEMVLAVREIVENGGVSILQRHADKCGEYLATVVRDGGRGASRRIADLLNTLGRQYEQKRQAAHNE